MAWITPIPPSPRHPHGRYRVGYQDGKRQRSAGIFPTKRRALAEKRAIESGGEVATADVKCQMLPANQSGRNGPGEQGRVVAGVGYSRGLRLMIERGWRGCRVL